jgi:hypothetical protein
MFGMVQYLKESVLDPFLNWILTPQLLSAWQGLTSDSQMRIAILLGCCVLVGALLMTAGARFLLFGGLLLLATPKIAEIAHHISGSLDEAYLRNILLAVALLAGGVGAVLATFTVAQRAVLVALAGLVAVLVYAPAWLGPLSIWIQSVVPLLNGHL